MVQAQNKQAKRFA